MEENNLNTADVTDKNGIENTIFSLIAAIKQYRGIFFASIIITSLTGLVYALVATSLFRADVTMISNQAEGEALGNLARQYGAIASLAGINVGSSSATVVTDTDRSLAILTSRSFIEEFAVRRNIKPILFKELWDGDKKEWEDGLEPTAAQTYEVMTANVIDINIDRRTNLISFSVVWSDPKTAADWANQMIEDLNEKIRFEEVAEYKRSISFVEEQLNEYQQDHVLSDLFTQTSKTTLRGVMISLVEQLTKKVMVANVRDEYAFKIIDPAVVPEKKYKPSKTNIVIISFLSGVFLGLFLILSIGYIKNLKLNYQLFSKHN